MPLLIDAAEPLNSWTYTVDGELAAISPPPERCDPPSGLRVWLNLLELPTEVALWDVADWDVGTWSDAPAATAADVTADVLRVRWRRGSPGLGQPVEAGRIAVELRNDHGRYSPFTVAPTPHYARLDASIPAWVTWDDPDDGVRRLWTGYLYALSDTWVAGRNGAPERAYANGEGADAFAVLEGIPYDQVAAGEVAGELAGARIARVLDAAGWGLGRRIDAGAYGLAEDPDPADSALTELHKVAWSDGGRVFVAGDGTLEYADGDRPLRAERELQVQLVVTDRPDTAPALPGVPVVCYDGTTAGVDTGPIVNLAQIGADGVTTQTREDLTSQATYGVRALRDVDTLLTSSADAAARAQRLIDERARASRRVRSVTFDLARRSEVERAAILRLELGDRIRWIRHPPSGDTIDLELAVLALDSNAEGSAVSGGGYAGRWSYTIETGPTLLEGDVARWDVADWDTGLWAP